MRTTTAAGDDVLMTGIVGVDNAVEETPDWRAAVLLLLWELPEHAVKMSLNVVT